MSFLKVIPKCFANPKKIQFCKSCNRIIQNDKEQFCQYCYGALDNLNYISYIAHIDKSSMLSICPNCNSFHLKDNECDDCNVSFDKPKIVNKVKWIKTNFPEVYQ